MQDQTNALWGMDVSHNNGKIDWNKAVATGIQFAYLKASQGTTFTDPNFGINVQNARNAGMQDIGAYHYADPLNNKASDEAVHFFNVMQQYMPDYGDIMPVLDLESPTDANATTGDYLTSWTNEFMNELAYLTGRVGMLYTGEWFIDQFNITGLNSFPIWVAYYGPKPPPDDGGWDHWTAWQYSESGSVNGVGGNVDMDYAVSIDALRGYKDCDLVRVSTANVLNIRKGPSTMFPVTDTVPQGTRMHITKLSPSWAFTPDRGGWVSRKYLTTP